MIYEAAAVLPNCHHYLSKVERRIESLFCHRRSGLLTLGATVSSKYFMFDGCDVPLSTPRNVATPSPKGVSEELIVNAERSFLGEGTGSYKTRGLGELRLLADSSG